MTRRSRALDLPLWALWALFACNVDQSLKLGELQPERSLPEQPSGGVSATPYSGDNALVQQAQALYYDGFALHAEVIKPTCGPINGVCHNAKEYPDLHTPANFVGAVDAPCNVQAGTPEGVYDRCERPGDRLRLGDERGLEIGYIEYVAGELAEGEVPGLQSPGLHLYLAGTLAVDRDEFWGQARFIRSFVSADSTIEQLPFFTYESRFYILERDGYRFEQEGRGTHVLAQVRPHQTRDIEALLSVGVVEGDRNRNGTFGARHEDRSAPVKMIAPGRPESSYLLGRMRGALAGEPIPGSRMPLANEPLDNAEMLALYCFIEGLGRRSGPVDMAAPIDYEQCSYSRRPEDLELLGTGVTWEGRIKNILEFNCGGCHGGNAPAAGLNLKDGDVFARLQEPSSQALDLKLVEAGQPMRSYLWLKLNGDPSILGAPMPIDPLDGNRRLRSDELSDIRTWIEEDALPSPSPEPEPDLDAGTPDLDAGH